MVALDYVEKLMDSKSPKVSASMIGIISPYHQQVSVIVFNNLIMESMLYCHCLRTGYEDSERPELHQS